MHLERDVVLALGAGSSSPPAPVAHDGPEDEHDDQRADDDRADREALPEVVGRARGRRRPGLGAEVGHRAARQGHRGQRQGEEPPPAAPLRGTGRLTLRGQGGFFHGLTLANAPAPSGRHELARGPGEDAARHRRGRRGRARRVDARARRADRRVVGRAPATRAPTSWPARRRSASGPSTRARRARPAGPVPPASAHSSAARARSAGRLEVRRVAVPPPAVQAPDVAHDELRLVVHGLEVRPAGEVGRRRDRLETSASRAPAFISASVWSTRDSRYSAVSVERLADPVRADDRQAVAGQEDARRRARPCAAARPPTRAGSAGPSGGCRRWGVDQMKRSPGQSTRARGEPGHGGVVGLAHLVAQLDLEAAHVERERRGVRTRRGSGTASARRSLSIPNWRRLTTWL